MAVNGVAAAQDVADLKVSTAALATAMGTRVGALEGSVTEFQETANEAVDIANSYVDEVAALVDTAEAFANDAATAGTTAAEAVVDEKLNRNFSNIEDTEAARENLRVMGYRTRFMVSEQEETIYCDPVEGSDTNPGTLSEPLRTLQEAIDRVPKILYHRYKINLRAAPEARGGLPAIYDEDILIQGLLAQTRTEDPNPATTMLWIDGAGGDPNTSDSTDVQIGSIFVSGCLGVATPYVYGAHILRATPHYEQAAYYSGFGCSEFGGQNLSFAATSPAVAGVRAYGSGCIVKLSDFTNCTNAIWAKRNARVAVSDCVGNTSAAAWRVEENSVIQPIRCDVSLGGAGTAQATAVQGGGLVIDQSGNIIRGSGSGGGIFMGWPADGAMKLSPAEGVGGYSVAIGDNFRCSVANAVAIGKDAECLGASSVAVGALAKSGAFVSNTVIGPSARALSARRATAVGAVAQADYENSGAFGYNAVSPGAGVYKIGNNAALTVDLNYRVGNLQVVGARKTGWEVDDGTAKRTANATYTAGTAIASPTGGATVDAEGRTAIDTLIARIALLETAVQNASQTIKALKDDLHGAAGHGLIGA